MYTYEGDRRVLEGRGKKEREGEGEDRYLSMIPRLDRATRTEGNTQKTKKRKERRGRGRVLWVT